MTDNSEIFLDVVTVPDGVKIVSRHPHSQHRRHVVVGLNDGRLSVHWGYDESKASTSEAGVAFADATPTFIVKGDIDGAESILEALNYPRDERAAAARFLIETVPAAVPASVAAAVDQRAIEALRAVSAPSILNLDFYSGDGERADRRRQAANSLPLFAGRMASTLSLKMTVDRSKPLTEALIGAFDGRTSGTISKAVIRRLSGVSDKPFMTDLDTVIEFASRVPADWIPASGADWRAFCLIADGVVNQLRLSTAETTKFLKGCSGKWAEFAVRMTAPISPEGCQDDLDRSISVAFRHLSEMLECFSNVVVLPLAVHGAFVSHVTVNVEAKHRAFDVAKKMMFGEKSAPSLVEVARKWHSHRASILDATRLSEQERRQVMLKDVPPNGWPALCDSVVAPNGLTLVPLNTPEQLSWEGDGDKYPAKSSDPSGAKGLNHCVGGYANKCHSGNSHIFSIREIDENGTYRRVSTIEFSRLDPTSNNLHKVQHYGHSDTTPIGKAQDAVDWFMETVALGNVRLNRELIAAFDKTVLDTMDGVERFCGFDWRDADTLATALVPWGPYVDGSYRRLGFEGLLALDDMAVVRDSIPPELIGVAATLRS